MKRAALILSAVLLHGCASPVREIGRPPDVSEVGSGITREERSLDRFPERPAKAVNRYSLWDDRRSNLFTDRRAMTTGDILTVDIAIADKARLSNQSDRSRTANKSLGLSASYDLDGAGNSVNGDATIGSTTDFEGTGATVRSETINLAVAAMVTDILPNGNLMIQGSQEVLVNSELRVLKIAGIVRPSDIGPDNTISYERIAEARVSYGGRGRISEVQEPPYGQQILDRFLPF
ncbi:MAG: flagellar basal body L-ring protein FlgH [Rhizobiaceae bacterium]